MQPERVTNSGEACSPQQPDQPPTSSTTSSAMARISSRIDSSARSPQLEISFLLNHAHGTAAASPATGRTTAQVQSKPDNRDMDGSSAVKRRFSCDSCDATFTVIGSALKHKRTVHEKLRAYKCDTCGKHFSEMGSMNRHKKSVHLNERPFSCKICSSSFALRANLRRHLSTVHQGIRRFKCGKCEADFKQVAHLRKHERSHKCVSTFTAKE